MKNARVFYYDKKTPVMVGDQVETKIMFMRRLGRVVYVPGVSLDNSEMEDEGLVYVGIQVDGGPFVGTVVDPGGSFLKRKVNFIGRDPSPVEELKPDQDPFE